MGIVRNIKTLFCLHEYVNEQKFYIIKREEMCELKYELKLYSIMRCKKCNKREISEEGCFRVPTVEHLLTIRNLVESHGAIPYYSVEGKKK